MAEFLTKMTTFIISAMNLSLDKMIAEFLAVEIMADF